METAKIRHDHFVNGELTNRFINLEHSTDPTVDAILGFEIDTKRIELILGTRSEDIDRGEHGFREFVRIISAHPLDILYTLEGILARNVTCHDAATHVGRFDHCVAKRLRARRR